MLAGRGCGRHEGAFAWRLAQNTSSRVSTAVGSAGEGEGGLPVLHAICSHVYDTPEFRVIWEQRPSVRGGAAAAVPHAHRAGAGRSGAASGHLGSTLGATTHTVSDQNACNISYTILHKGKVKATSTIVERLGAPLRAGPCDARLRCSTKHRKTWPCKTDRESARERSQ